MSIGFHHQLDTLTTTIGELCAHAGRAVQGATQALLHADVALAESVISEYDKIVRTAAHAERDALKLLTLHAPVASDLRTVVASLKNVTDACHMGGLALHVSEIVRSRHPAHALPDELKGYFAEMGRIAVDLSRTATNVVVSGNPDQAAKLAHDDDAMDELHRLLFSILMDRQWSHTVATAVDITLLSRYYERFADHAVTVGQRVIFQATGTHVAQHQVEQHPTA